MITIETDPEKMSPRGRKLHDWFMRWAKPFFGPEEEGEEYVSVWLRRSAFRYYLISALVGANIGVLYAVFLK
mgnify:CR=1 FL=1